MYHRILCPVGFDPQSARILSIAAHLARTFEAMLAVLCVLPADPDWNEQASAPEIVTSPEDKRRRHALYQLGQMVSREQGASSVPCELEVCFGDLAIEIVAAAHHSDLLVIASQDWLGQHHFSIGSIAEYVVRTSPCPVFIVPIESGRRRYHLA